MLSQFRKSVHQVGSCITWVSTILLVCRSGTSSCAFRPFKDQHISSHLSSVEIVPVYAHKQVNHRRHVDLDVSESSECGLDSVLWRGVICPRNGSVKFNER